MASPVDDSLYNEVGDYLLQTELWHDCHFLVGENKERIGAVRCNLINQSRVWWSMLSPDSPLVEKGIITLPDIDPEAFKLLLKHCYGGLVDYSSLSSDIMVNLCYCANKYLMTHMMEKITVHLQATSLDQVFPALQCFVNYNLVGVKESVDKIVQTKTKEMFAHPEFLECDAESITYIAKQDMLSCNELELWRAVVTWAKHRAQSEEGHQLRSWMLGPLQHIRLLTFNNLQLHDEVFSTEILTSFEIARICKKNVAGVNSLCGETKNRVINMKNKYDNYWDK